MSRRRRSDRTGRRGRLRARDVAAPRMRVRSLPQLDHVALVAAGGAVGALARVALAEASPVLPDAFPWTTFAENVTGAFALALVLTLLAERATARPAVRLALCTGALGAFTTYSTLALEATERLAGGHALLGVGYALASVVVGLLAALAGVRVARGLPRRRATGGRR